MSKSFVFRLMVIVSTLVLFFSQIPIQVVSYAASKPILPTDRENGEKKPEILFRGFSWGISADEIRDCSDDLLSGIDWYIEYNSAVDVEKSLFGIDGQLYRGDVRQDYYTIPTMLKGKRIAGYDLMGVYLLFARTPNEDGILDTDPKHTALYLAQYRFKPTDIEYAYEDLTKKLTSLYGQFAYESQDERIIKRAYRGWYGENGTMVSILKEIYSSGTQNLYIRYGFVGGDELLQKAEDALAFEERKRASSDTEGL